MTSALLRSDALRLPLADGTVDLVVTSPPYFSMRSYRDGDEHYAGQLGSEATPQAFIEALMAATAEMARVLKPSGSIFVNLGDKYDSSSHSMHGQSSSAAFNPGHHADVNAHSGGRRPVFTRPKSLMLLPERYRIGCVDRLGLIARAVICWCVSGGAKVYARLPTGDRPIMLRDLVRHYQPENVQLWNGEKWTQVLGWNRSADTDGALELELRSGERIGCTVGHRWPTSRGLLRADEIRVGDIIDTCALPEPDQPRSPAFLPDEDTGWLVGLYIAEGSRSETTVQIAGHIKETARNARLARIAAALDATCNVYQTGENFQSCNLRGTVLSGVIDRYVSPGTAKTKRLNLPAWQRSNRFLSAVVEGYLDGDGGYDAKNDRWRLGFTSNDEWAADLRTLAARLGASLTLKRSASTAFADSSGPRVFPGWRGEWRWAARPHRNSKVRSEVVTIRLSRARQFFDVGVADEPHLFALASGVLTHNSKPNGLPESVTDRVRRSHEDWVHLTKEPRYYSAVDEIREEYSENKPWGDGSKSAQKPAAATASLRGHLPSQHQQGLGSHRENPLGKLPGSVWTIPTEPLRVPDWVGVDHFAAFPTEWPRRLILGWSPSGVCVECGEGRRPVVEPTEAYRAKLEASRQYQAGTQNRWGDEGGAQAGFKWHPGQTSGETSERVITGEACACPAPDAPTRPSVVLDPFVGTGTTVMVARALGRYGVGVDLSADYLRLARWRVFESGNAAKAVARTWRERQGGLFDGEDAA